jgi:AcrR family transcriptional regulator
MTVSEEPLASVRQQQAAATRQQLLTAAGEVFEERGYQATSVGAITARADTAHGTFYLYFKNKEDAFCQVMENVILEELAVTSEASEGRELSHRQGIEVVIQAFMSFYGPRIGLWRAVVEGMLQSARIRELWLDLRRRFIHNIAASLEEQCAAGIIRPLDPLMSAHALGSMTEWFAFAFFELHEPPGADGEFGQTYEHAVEVLVDLWEHAVYGEVPAFPS